MADQQNQNEDERNDRGLNELVDQGDKRFQKKASEQAAEPVQKRVVQEQSPVPEKRSILSRVGEGIRSVVTGDALRKVRGRKRQQDLQEQLYDAQQQNLEGKMQAVGKIKLLEKVAERIGMAAEEAQTQQLDKQQQLLQEQTADQTEQQAVGQAAQQLTQQAAAADAQRRQQLQQMQLQRQQQQQAAAAQTAQGVGKGVSKAAPGVLKSALKKIVAPDPTTKILNAGAPGLGLFHKYLKWILPVVIAVIAFGFIGDMTAQWSEIADQGWSIVDQAHAQNPTGQAATNTNQTGGIQQTLGTISNVLGTTIAGLATLFIKLISGIVMFCLMMIGPLMDNTYIMDGDMGEKLRTVWVIIRNFVNIFFALALVVIALLSVIGVGDESGNYALKKFIPKMAIALIAINFTFLAARVVLDVNNVLTTAIFSIPQSVTGLSDVGPTGLSGTKIFKKFKCLDNTEKASDASKRASDLSKKFNGTIADFAGVCFAISPPDSATLATLTTPDAINDRTQQAIISLDASQFTNKNVVWAMATQFQGLHGLNKVSTLLDPTGSGLTVNALYSAVIAVVYATAYISLFIILLARMAVLWITIMLSPLIAINIMFPDLPFGDFDIRKEFIKHAFVPVKIAIPLSLGYVMLSQMTIAVDPNSAVFEGIDFSQGGEFARGVSFRTMIYGAASIAVVWMGVFAASKDVIGGEVATGFMEKIKGIGKTVARWPTYLPIIPVSGGGASIANLQYAMSDLNRRIAERGRIRNEAFANRTLDDILPRAEVARAIDQIRESSRGASTLNTGALSTLAGAGGLAVGRFGPQMLELLNGMDNNQKLQFAQTAGFARTTAGVQQLETALRRNDREEIQTIRNRISGGGGGTTPPAGTAPDYTTVARNLGGVTVTNQINLNQSTGNASTRVSNFNNDLTEATRNALQITEANPTINPTNLTAKNLVDAINGTRGPADRRVLINTGLITNTARTRSDIRTLLASDRNLLTRLSSAIHTNPGTDTNMLNDNKRIREMFERIANSEDNNALIALGPGGVEAAAINRSTGAYTTPST